MRISALLVLAAMAGCGASRDAYLRREAESERRRAKIDREAAESEYKLRLAEAERKSRAEREAAEAMAEFEARDPLGACVWKAETIYAQCSKMVGAGQIDGSLGTLTTTDCKNNFEVATGSCAFRYRAGSTPSRPPTQEEVKAAKSEIRL